MTIIIKQSNFETEVLNAQKPVLVDFWAEWCPYCRKIAPAFDKIETQFDDALITAKINCDEEVELAERFNVNTIPMLMLFNNGKVIGSLTAPESKAAIEGFIRNHLNI